MGLPSTALLALSMSADAFAVSVGKGVSMDKPRLLDAAKTGLVFGLTEGCAPLVGWLFGSFAASFIQAYDHWVAFVILTLIGLHMIVEGVRNQNCELEIVKPKDQNLLMLILTAVGTSIDSVAVGVSLAFVAANIWVAAISIGLATFSMSTLGIMIGHRVGCKLGRYAEILGGVGLFAIGAKILFTHLAE
ncbi:MAG: manganese efflux pump MntP family protein [Alphaproteobacteria bacterium]|nr:manganese efflux pump MntP family protein [Alphaproteobacteria bacterium]